MRRSSMAAIGGATLGVAGVAALVARMTRGREPRIV